APCARRDCGGCRKPHRGRRPSILRQRACAGPRGSPFPLPIHASRESRLPRSLSTAARDSAPGNRSSFSWPSLFHLSLFSPNVLSGYFPLSTCHTFSRFSCRPVTIQLQSVSSKYFTLFLGRLPGLRLDSSMSVRRLTEP